jgi:hypothetical protein
MNETQELKKPQVIWFIFSKPLSIEDEDILLKAIKEEENKPFFYYIFRNRKNRIKQIFFKNNERILSVCKSIEKNKRKKMK